MISVMRIRDVLLASMPPEISDGVVEDFQNELLAMIESSTADGVVVDVSKLEILDSYAAQVLVKTGKMARLMGTRTVIVGIRPEVAATLIRMGLKLSVETALNVDEGLKLVEGNA